MGAHINQAHLSSDEKILQCMLNALRALYYLEALECWQQTNRSAPEYYAAKQALEMYFDVENYHTIEHDNPAEKILEGNQAEIKRALEQTDDTCKIKSWSIDYKNVPSTDHALEHLKGKLSQYATKMTARKSDTDIYISLGLALVSFICLQISSGTSLLPSIAPYIALPAFILFAAYAVVALILPGRQSHAFLQTHIDQVANQVDEGIARQLEILKKPGNFPVFQQVAQDAPQGLATTLYPKPEGRKTPPPVQVATPPAAEPADVAFSP